MHKPTKKRWIFSTIGVGFLAPVISPAFLFLFVFQSTFAVFQGDPGVGLYLAGGLTFAFLAGLVPALAGVTLLAAIIRLRWRYFESAKPLAWMLLGAGIGIVFALIYFMADLENFDGRVLFSVLANNFLTGAIAAYLFRRFLLQKREKDVSQA